MTTAPVCRTTQPTFLRRLVALLSATDQAIAWWGTHRAWPASEFAAIGEKH